MSEWKKREKVREIQELSSLRESDKEARKILSQMRKKKLKWWKNQFFLHFIQRDL